MLPVTEIKITKRAIFKFIGRFAKSIIGLSTVEDSQILATHINQIQKNEKLNTNLIHQLGEALQSYIKTLSDNVDLFDTANKLNTYALNLTRTTFSNH